jgi:hypothetical protein
MVMQKFEDLSASQAETSYCYSRTQESGAEIPMNWRTYRASRVRL